MDCCICQRTDCSQERCSPGGIHPAETTGRNSSHKTQASTIGTTASPKLTIRILAFRKRPSSQKSISIVFFVSLPLSTGRWLVIQTWNLLGTASVSKEQGYVQSAFEAGNSVRAFMRVSNVGDGPFVFWLSVIQPNSISVSLTSNFSTPSPS